MSTPVPPPAAPPPAPLRPPPPPPSARPSPARAATAPAGTLSVSRGIQAAGSRIVFFGPGGIGKSTFASHFPSPVFLDLKGGTRGLDVARVQFKGPDGLTRAPATIEEVRAALVPGVLAEHKTVVVDTGTDLQELAEQFAIRTIPHEKGLPIRYLEDYGWGKGYRHVHDVFMPVIADLDRLAEAGKHIVFICHDCTASVPNPGGLDWLQYQPFLQDQKLGNIRERVYQWADHVVYLGFEVAVSQDGKGYGAGSRFAWFEERPTHRAKVRQRVQRGLAEKHEFSDPGKDPATVNAIINALLDPLTES